MLILNSIKMASSSILSHKLRSSLTILGLIIGLGSVISIITLGQMGEVALRSQFIGDGTNQINVTYNPTPEGETIDLVNYSSTYETTPKINENDVMEIRKHPLVKNLLLSNSRYSNIVSMNNLNSQAQVLGIEKVSFNSTDIAIMEGRAFNSNDFNVINTVALITDSLSQELFPKVGAVGSYVTVDGEPVEVIGTYMDVDNKLGFKNNILIPLLLYQNIYRDTSIDSIKIEAVDTDSIQKAGQEVINILNGNLSDSYNGQYEVLNLKEMEESISILTNTMTILISGIASISLIVAGIGIMNIMLVTVTERTREIGIRKALGATRRAILLQFLIESSILSLVGGILGITLSLGGISILAFFLNWPIVFSPLVIIGALLFSVFLGVIFGLLPADRGARLEPVDALKYE